MEVLGWIGVLCVAAGVAIAPAFPFVRRLLGLTEDTPEAQAVRSVLRFWDRGARPRGVRAGGGAGSRRRHAPRLQERSFAYPQQLPIRVADGALVAPTNLDLLERDRALFAQAEDPWGEANVLNLIGFIRERHGEFGQALEMHRQALTLFERIQDPLGIGDSHNNRGVVLGRLGKASASLAHHHRALEVRQPLDDVRVSNSHNNIAVVLSSEKTGGPAAEHLRQAARISEATEGDPRGRGKIINNTTVLEIEVGCEEGRGEQLSKQFRTALDLRNATEDQRGNAKTRNNLAIVHALQGDLAGAAEHFDVAATLAGSVEDHVGLVHILSNWRQLEAARGSAPEVVRQLDDRIAAGRRVLPGVTVGPDCEAFRLKCGSIDLAPGQTALLSSGSATPATAAELEDRLRRRESAI